MQGKKKKNVIKKDNFQTKERKRIQRDFTASLTQLGSRHQRVVRSRKQSWTLAFRVKNLVQQKTTQTRSETKKQSEQPVWLTYSSQICSENCCCFFFFFTFIVLHYKSIILNPQAAHLHLMGNLWMWMMQADQHGILYVKNCQYWLLHQERELHCCLSNMRQNTRYQRADTYKRKLLQLVLWRLVKFQDDKHDLCSSVWFLANCFWVFK